MGRLSIGNLVRIKIVSSGFNENFESGWFINRQFSSLFIDNFENWFVDNIFTKISEDYFEIGWFINNLFTQQFIEGFEDVSWN